MTETASMAESNDRQPNNYQPKKKKTEEPLPPDIGLKPVQLQRRRVWRACESCRRKKIKCDGTEPTCSQCATSKTQCTWLQTKDRAALSRHYVQELEARLLHMETLFQQVAPILEQVGQAGGIDTSKLGLTPGDASSNIPPQPVLSNINESEENNETDSPANPVKLEDEVSESFGQLALDEHGQMRWIGSSSTMSLINSFRSLTSAPLHRVSPMEDDPLGPGPSVNKLYFPASVLFGKVHALPSPEEVEFPPRDLADKLVDAYFSRFHFLFPIIDKPNFLLRYTNVMNNVGDAGLAARETAFIALTNSVFACAVKLIEDPRLRIEGDDAAGMGMIYYERALILQYISHASMQVEHVQCFLLMSSFLCSVNCLPQAWIIVGQAIRIAQDIGLHRSPRRLLISPIEKETRRKVWWGCYILDRMLALTLGRPMGIDERDCDVELPADVDDEHLSDYFAGATMAREVPFLMKGFLELISLYEISGKVLRQVYSLDKCKEYLEPEKRAELNRSVESLDKALMKWCDDLPPVFKNSPAHEKHVSMAAVLCTHYYSILLTLHRNFLPVKPDQPILPRSTAKAVSTARACIHLAPSIRNVVPPCYHLAFFIQNLFSSAVIILLYSMHTTNLGASQMAMDEAKSCLGILEGWEGYWPGARKCKELLEDLAATAGEAMQALQAQQQQNLPTPPNMSNVSTPSTKVSSGAASPSAMQQDTRMGAPTTVPGSTSERILKNKARRNRSRDPRLSPRLMPQSGYHRHDPISQRARSTSRKRPHDEDYQDFGNPSLSSVLSGSYPGRSNLSSHSSPVSVHSHPSPPRLEPPLEASPPIMPIGSFSMSMPPQSPTTVSMPSSSRFSYDFSQSPPENRWAGPSESNGSKNFYDSPVQGSSSGGGYGNTYAIQPTTSVDSNNSYSMSYDTNDLISGLPSLSTVPELTDFSGPGLPFRGLELLRNFNGGNSGTFTPGGSQGEMWQTFDPGAFGLDPEVAFSLRDLNFDGTQNTDSPIQWDTGDSVR
ncbi:fungal-specific transcription factor domain-containing protein [Irpex rosettiformis]|uniref:Fungal-specific transcription factor domain-containing protein n=1 Tax=Irpex rosettiformis TaxID=378272 RepID=A0ACB8UEY8_9APHY|nr:fungal-specific transcription factor domain-containing protein [Irpex rosettiformis]